MKKYLLMGLLSLSASAMALEVKDLEGTWSSCLSHQPGWSYFTEVTFTADHFVTKAAIYQNEICKDRLVDEQVTEGTFELGEANEYNDEVTDLNLESRSTGPVYGVVKIENGSLCISDMSETEYDRPTEASCDLNLKKQAPVSFFGDNLCTRYTGRAEHMKAINVVAKSLGLTEAAICSKADVVDIEAMLSQKTNEQGEVIPHIRVQLHRAYDSCLYMVNRQTWGITEQRCFQTW